MGPLPETFLHDLRARLASDLATSYPAPHTLYQELTHALDVAPERVLVTSGNDAALRSVHLAFARTGDAVVRLDPTYAMLPIYARMFAVQEVTVGYDDQLQLDVDSLLEAVRPGVRLVILANPNQPTGTLLRDPEIEALIDRCEQEGVLLVLDEAYYPFSGYTGLRFAAAGENVLVLRTFSKAAGLAGLRVGYAVGPPAVVRALYKVRSAGETNALAIEAARLVVERPEIVDDYVAAVEEGRTLLTRRALELGLEPLPGHANFVLIRIPAPRDPRELVEGLRGRGYLIRGPYSHPALERCIRVTLAAPEVMDAFADELAAVWG